MKQQTEELVASVTRLVSAVADLVELEVKAKQGGETQPSLPFDDHKLTTPVITETTKEVVTEEKPKKEKKKKETPFDVKEVVGAQVENFVKRLQAKGIDGIAEAKKVIAMQDGCKKLSDIKPEQVEKFLKDLDLALAEFDSNPKMEGEDNGFAL